MPKIPEPGGELLRTERLIIRRFRIGDVAAYSEMMNQPSVEASLSPGPKSHADAARQMAMYDGHWGLTGFGLCAAIEKNTGQLVGRVGPWFPYGWPAPEVGWTIHPRRQRRGYAAEAARACSRWMLETHPELDRVIHLIEPRNTGSQRVAAAIGGVNTGEGFLHPAGIPLDIWATPRSALLDK